MPDVSFSRGAHRADRRDVRAHDTSSHRAYLAPYSPAWFTQLAQLSSSQAQWAAGMMAAARRAGYGPAGVCFYCGEGGGRLYLQLGGPSLPLYLCSDCRRYAGQLWGSKFQPLAEPPAGVGGAA